MDTGDDCDTRAWFERTPPGCRRRVVVVEAGEEMAYDGAAWVDSIVLVERGEVELECASGGRERFAQGALLCLGCVQLRTLRNLGEESAVLIAVTRAPAQDSATEARGAPTA
jgi:hypothetical protein